MKKLNVLFKSLGKIRQSFPVKIKNWFMKVDTQIDLGSVIFYSYCHFKAKAAAFLRLPKRLILLSKLISMIVLV